MKPLSSSQSQPLEPKTSILSDNPKLKEQIEINKRFVKKLQEEKRQRHIRLRRINVNAYGDSSIDGSPRLETTENTEGSASKRSRLVKLNLSEMGKRKWNMPLGLHNQIKK